jgi:hypothetical protein
MLITTLSKNSSEMLFILEQQQQKWSKIDNRIKDGRNITSDACYYH